MPELPEVETIANTLRHGIKENRGEYGLPPIVGKEILEAHVLWERTVASPSLQEFLKRIKGQTILDIGRRGKFLVLTLSRDALLIHLRMSGDLLLESDGQPPAPHHRLMLVLEGGLRLSFNDTRKFGRVWLTSDSNDVLGNLGPEPLDATLTAEEFHQRLITHRRQLKPLLMDQTFLAGLGNIYVDEALHLAKLHPQRGSNTLSLSEAVRLLVSIRLVLREGIRRNGASIDWVYRGGDFQNYFRVYKRSGLPCFECGTPIQRIVLGQRGTHFCPTCQNTQASS